MKPYVPSLFAQNLSISDQFSPSERIVVYPGDCLEMLRAIPAECMQLIVTSPPYNIGKEYEKRLDIDLYLRQQAQVIAECVRTLAPMGSICWQVGNYVDRGAIIPLDTVLYPIFAGLGLRMRNRIIWHFEHGLHCSRRFSGRYETIIWFTKSDEYVFNLDAVRVPQKYPGKKYFKGPKAGQYSEVVKFLVEITSWLMVDDVMPRPAPAARRPARLRCVSPRPRSVATLSLV